METKFINFVNENFINENKVYRSYKVFITDVRKALVVDFKNTRMQALEYIELYNELFKKLWQSGFTVREAIAATKRPGFKIDDDDDTNMEDIDKDFDEIEEEIEESKSSDIINNINEYYKKYSTSNYSDVRVFERVKNNYTKLLNKYKEKFESVENVENEIDMKIYDINTWKYLMFEPSKELGIINGIESIRTGDALTKKELAKLEEKGNEIYIKNGYKLPERHSDKPDWYKYMDIRFDVTTKNGSASWHIKKVLPLTEERFFKLGGENYQKRVYKSNKF